MKYAMIRTMLRALAVLLAACLATIASAEEAAAPAEAPPSAAGLAVYFLDLGRVDGILILCDGESSFIDVGFESDAKPALQFMRAMGLERLNSYIGTHGHADHIDGAPEIIEAMRPDRVYISHLGCLSAILDCADDAQKSVIAATERIILTPGDTFAIGGATLTCLGPLTLYQGYTGDYKENYNSLILRLDYGERSMLFTGDTTDKILRQVAGQYPGMLDVDVLKNPHHNGTHDEDVLRLVSPRAVVFCTDDDDQPQKSYMSMLSEMGVRAFLTGRANNGHVAVLSDGEGLEVRCGYSTESVSIAPVPDLAVGQTYAPVCEAVSAQNISPDRHLGWNSSDEGVVVAHNGRLMAVAPGVATVTAVSVNGVSASAEVRVFSACVRLDQEALTLAVGETGALSGRIEPEDAEGVSGEWFSEDESVATVSGGKVTGVGKGTTRVVARLSNGFEAACAVTVTGVPAKSVKLDRSKATMKVGDTLSLSATVKPEGYDLENLEWQSSDESILWVDQYGNVTAVRKGRAKIAAVASKGVYAVCTIKVE